LTDGARQKVEGLKTFYQVTDDSAVSFFKAHQSYDVFHAEAEISLMTELCKDEETEKRAIIASEETLGALHDFLDGVERRYKVA
jgi:pyrroloquinoline quinone (PQQ) biosynthesis protein C